MERQIIVKYPEELAFSLKMGDSEFEKEIRKISLIKLYELGKISSGFAARLLSISRIDFIELLGLYNVSIFPENITFHS
jgi:predicted HTH domain antitoxin